MKPEDWILFSATRQTVNADQKQRLYHLTQESPIDWDAVFATAENNGIGPLIFSNIINIPELAAQIPHSLVKQYKLKILQNIAAKKERSGLLRQALKFCREKQIKVMIIKGAAQDLITFREPWFTVYFDIDLILHAPRDILPQKILRQINDEFYQDRIEYDFYSHHDVSMNGMLPINFAEIWREAREIQIEAETAYVPSPEHHLLTLAINSCRKRFFRLKSLLDIAETIEALPDIDWDKFAHYCRSYHCGNIVYTAFLVTQKTLIGQIPEQVYAKLGVSTFRAEMIQKSVTYLIKFWSITASNSKSWIYSRLIDPRLILPYTTYLPSQIRHKIFGFGK